MVQRVEELPDVHHVDIPASHPHDAAPQCLQRLVTGPAGAETIRAGKKVLLTL